MSSPTKVNGITHVFKVKRVLKWFVGSELPCIYVQPVWPLPWGLSGAYVPMQAICTGINVTLGNGWYHILFISSEPLS